MLAPKGLLLFALKLLQLRARPDAAAAPSQLMIQLMHCMTAIDTATATTRAKATAAIATAAIAIAVIAIAVIAAAAMTAKGGRKEGHSEAVKGRDERTKIQKKNYLNTSSSAFKT